MAIKSNLSKRFYLFIVISALAILNSGCSSDQLPNDTQISISPASHTIDIIEQRDANDRCLFNPDNHVDLPLVLGLTNGDGSPIGDSEISVYLDFAGNTFSGFPALSLYEDRNSNGVVDAETELVSGSDDDIAVVKTGRYDGSHRMLLRVNLSCGYRGGVYAVAGGNVARSSISVTAEEQKNTVVDSMDRDATGAGSFGASS